MRQHDKIDKALLREFVAEIIKEEGDGGGGGDLGTVGGIVGASYGMMPFGARFTDAGTFYNAFIKPFSDVIGVTLGKTKEMGARAVTAAKVAWETLGSTFIPWLSSEYDQIFKEQEESLKKIIEEYSDVYNATWDAFKTNDVAITAFLCYPGIVLTGLFARKTPDTAARLLSILSGGTLDKRLAGLKSQFGSTKHSSSKKEKSGPLSTSGGTELPMSYMESVLHEKHTKKKQKTFGDALADPELVKAALSSEYAKRMQHDARALIHDSLNKIASRALKALSARSIEDLQKLSGKPLKGADELKSLSPAERSKVEATLLATARKATKEYFKKELTAQLKSAIDAGIPSESNFVRDYTVIIKKINDA